MHIGTWLLYTGHQTGNFWCNLSPKFFSLLSMATNAKWLQLVLYGKGVMLVFRVKNAQTNTYWPTFSFLKASCSFCKILSLSLRVLYSSFFCCICWLMSYGRNKDQFNIKIKKVSETKGLERLTMKRITFIGKALLLPFYQTTITKQKQSDDSVA